MQDKTKDRTHLTANPIDWPGISAILLTAITWGLTGIFIRWLDGLSATAITSGRLFIALVIVVPFLLFSRASRASFRTDLFNPWAWILSSLLTMYYIAAVTAFQAAPVADVALLISSSPLFVLVYQIIFGISLRRLEVLGAIFGISGIALITLLDTNSSSPVWNNRIMGDVFALFAASATAAYAAVYRAAAHRDTAPKASNVAVMTFAIGGTLLGLWTMATEAPLEPQFSVPMLLAFFALGLISTAVPSIAFGIASRRLPVLVTSTIRLSTPVFATLFAFVLLDETPSIWTLPGGVLVLSGMFMVISPHQKPISNQ